MLKEKLAVCYTISGPTYVDNAVKKLTEVWSNDPNLYFFIITDDKNNFAKVSRPNLVIKEMQEFYKDYPEIEPHEYLLRSGTDPYDFGRRFVESGYKYPCQVQRFHLKLAIEHEITNVLYIGTDIDLLLNRIDPDEPDSFDVFSKKNYLYNAVSWWTEPISANEQLKVSAKIIKDRYGLEPKNPNEIWIHDEAARLYIFENVEFMQRFFEMWHYVVGVLFQTGDMQRYFEGTIAWHEERFLGIIHDVLGINRPHDMLPLYKTDQNPERDRPWMVIK